MCSAVKMQVLFRALPFRDCYCCYPDSIADLTSDIRHTRSSQIVERNTTIHVPAMKCSPSMSSAAIASTLGSSNVSGALRAFQPRVSTSSRDASSSHQNGS